LTVGDKNPRKRQGLLTTMMAKVAGKPQQKATFWMGKFESGPN